MWVVLSEKHHCAAEPWDQGQRRPPLPYKVCALRLPKLIAPWVWWIVHIDRGSGIFDLRKNDRVNLISSWASNEDIVDDGLAKGKDV